MTLKIPKVRRALDADQTAFKIHLFRNAAGTVCGWYVGPVRITAEGVSLPYLPRSEETRASLAVARAIVAASERCDTLCLVDPDDLWGSAWGVA